MVYSGFPGCFVFLVVVLLCVMVVGLLYVFESRWFDFLYLVGGFGGFVVRLLVACVVLGCLLAVVCLICCALVLILLVGWLVICGLYLLIVLDIALLFIVAL